MFDFRMSNRLIRLKCNRIVSMVAEKMNKPWLGNGLIYKLIGKKNEEDTVIHKINTFTNKVLEEKSRKLDEETEQASGEDNATGIKRKTAFLDLLLKMKRENNAAFKTNSDIVEEVSTFTFEGHDTTTSSICFVLSLLAKHQDIQDEVYNEICGMHLDEDGHIKLKDYQNMQYLDRVIKEVGRIYATIPVIGRTLSKEVQLPSGYTLPAGSHVWISITRAHMNEKYFPDPEKFNPNHFLPEAVTNRHPYAYIPFSAGPRNCIGQKFATLETKSVVVAVLKKYKLEMTRDVVPNAVLVLTSSSGHYVKITARE